MTVRRVAPLSLLKQAFLAWRRDHASYLAAAVSYHAIFSLAPLCIIVLAITGAIYGQASTQQQFTRLLQEFVGQDSAIAIQQLLEQANLATRSGTALLVGIVLTLVGSIGVFKQLQQAVTIIWNHPPKKHSWKYKAVRYLLLFLLVLVSSTLLIASLVTSAVITQAGQAISRIIGFEASWILSVFNAVASLGIVTVLFAVLFRVLPDAPIKWRCIWKPALFTAVLFNIGKYVIGFYLGRSSLSSAYGAAGSLVALLVWIFYASQIFLYGIELVKIQHTHPKTL